MARLTDDGKVIRSPEGVPGLHIAWQNLGAWLQGELPDQRARLIMVRKGNPGGGGGDHGPRWRAGYHDGAHNVLHVVKDALGVNTPGHLLPRPASGTPERNGYDAAIAAGELALSRLSPG